MKRITNTPCPVAVNEIISFDDTFTDGTTNIEYTTAFDASFRNVKPRRGNTARRNTANFAIHEDVEVKSEKQQTTLSQPAKRILPSLRPSKTQIRDETAAVSGKASLQTTRHAKRRGISIVHTEDQATEHGSQEPALRRDSTCHDGQRNIETGMKRRDTLYIPSENTTQPTMWMGIFSPLKQEACEEKECSIADHVELTGIAARMVEKRRNSSRVVESKARRKPLHPSKVSSEQVNTINDLPGEPTGKENYPPTSRSKRMAPRSKPSSSVTDKSLPAINIDLQRKSFLSQARLKHLSQPKTVPEHAVPDISTMYEIGTHAFDAQKSTARKKSRDARPYSVANAVRSLEESRTTSTVPALTQSAANIDVPLHPTKFVQPCLEDLPTAPMHVPVIEHIENPSMYEENWLEHQEIVITQLLNVFFKQSETGGRRDPQRSVLRTELVGRYNGAELNLVYSRVQAATLYGSLSLSHEAMFNLHNLVHDVRRKKAFIKFWLNYDLELLHVALETVFGKQISFQDQERSPTAKSSPANTANKTKSIVQFIESHLLRHEDGHFKPAGTGSIPDLGSKTILKSIMLMKALDMIKDNTRQLSSKCLFRKTSPIKSSMVAVQCMMRMLNPSVGDPIRALRQLGYEVFHTQNPADDMAYGIDNLATDMRDGVNLARLVEMLLYGSKAKGSSMVYNDECHTIRMTDVQAVDIDNSRSWPLTQHLKLPCPSRASKIWNVQLSLEALRSIHSMKPLLEAINTADIVDGYREKTIKLLWMIIGQFGLAHLIDSIDLKQEIWRLKPPNLKATNTLDDESTFASAQERLEYLVKAWAKAVAASRGLTVRNFSTSFADGQVFRAILDEYEPYLCKGAISTRLGLGLRLSNLGCSRQFADLFDNHPGQMHIVGKDFVLAALVFLCSRVMGPSKLWRNAVKIQRCWRKHWSKVVQKRQAVKKELAGACATVVRFRQCASKSIETETKVDKLAGIMEKSEIENDIWLSV